MMKQSSVGACLACVLFLAGCTAEVDDSETASDSEALANEGTASPDAVKNHRLTCTGPHFIQSVPTGFFVSTEIGFPGNAAGMLRARATRVGSFERFFLCDDYHGGKAIKSIVNGAFVSTEIGFGGDYAGMMRARPGQATIGDWERFYLVGSYIISRASGAFVSAEYGYTGDYAGMLRARAAQAGPWEQWRIGNATWD
ncbi:MAG TPA: hypothetical protein VI072_07440 [Polyangiaceae bacterium]